MKGRLKFFVKGELDFDIDVTKNISLYGFSVGNFTEGQKIFNLINVDKTFYFIKGNCNLDNKIKFSLLFMSGKGNNNVYCNDSSFCYGLFVLF